MLSRAIVLATSLAFLGGAFAAEEPTEKPRPTVKPDATGLPVPDNRNDPEDRPGSASAGASADRDPAPAGATDLGKEADEEDEAARKGVLQPTKPSERKRR